MKRLCFLLVAAISSSHCVAAQWLEVAGSTGGSRSYAFSTDIDLDSIASSGQYKKAWIRARYVQSQKDGVREVLQIFYISCTENRYGVVQENQFSQDGRLIKSKAWPFSEALLIDVAPGSVSEAVVKFVCSTSSR
ncbi:surface-adhesin E family protein [Pseudoduganella violaceinigra]|uniref:surface-adhesin E family protein n=1 Tax=Pseudoduganella violaceinigra TaxID=246602 RepID=UPI0012B5DB7B|nr:surface-adhesin E family protein [Pseudoduganella violaceinigra]